MGRKGTVVLVAYSLNLILCIVFGKNAYQIIHDDTAEKNIFECLDSVAEKFYAQSQSLTVNLPKQSDYARFRLSPNVSVALIQRGFNNTMDSLPNFVLISNNLKILPTQISLQSRDKVLFFITETVLSKTDLYRTVSEMFTNMKKQGIQKTLIIGYDGMLNDTMIFSQRRDFSPSDLCHQPIFTTLSSKCSENTYNSAALRFVLTPPRNLKGCIAYVPVRDQPPFQIPYQENGLLKLAGSDVKLLEPLATSLNFSPRYTLVQNTNRTPYDLVDLSFGSVEQRFSDVPTTFETSSPYGEAKIVWLVPERYKSAWQSLSSAIRKGEFIAVGGFLFCVLLLVIGWIINFDGLKLVYLWGMFLGMINIPYSRSMSLRIGMILWVIFGQYACQQYTTLLSSFLTRAEIVPYANTPEELLNSDLELRMHSFFLNSLCKDVSPSKGCPRIVFQEIDQVLGYLQRKSGFDFALTVREDEARHSELYRYMKFHLMQEPIVSVKLTIWIRPETLDIGEVDQIIIRLTEAGLTEYWRQNYTDSIHVKDTEPTVMKLQHVSKIFIGLLVGLTFALVSFLGEIVYFHCRTYSKQ